MTKTSKPLRLSERLQLSSQRRVATCSLKSDPSQLVQIDHVFVEPTNMIGITRKNVCNDFYLFGNGYINLVFELVFGAFFLMCHKMTNHLVVSLCLCWRNMTSFCPGLTQPVCQHGERSAAYNLLPDCQKKKKNRPVFDSLHYEAVSLSEH